ncbi:hypothetical protein WJ70_26585 [Burkholderia ubonensis]|nr:hypothetical protein WJ70_26585 [Burkholderia ubonensis]
MRSPTRRPDCRARHADALQHVGLESDGGDRFFCGGGNSGKIRAVRRPARGATASADSTDQ